MTKTATQERTTAPHARGLLPRAASVLGGLFVLLGLGATAAAETPPPPPAATTTANGGAFGVGASAFLSGLGGVQFDYDQYMWDIEGIITFGDRAGNAPNASSRTQLGAGVRGWYHLNHGVNSDFSLGGGIGILHDTGNGPSVTATVIEPAARARVFITPNVAAHAVVGVSIVVGDNNIDQTQTGVALGAQFLGGFGFTYFFR